MSELSSCVQKEPFVKLDPSGKASILDYNLPQSTCYRATSGVNLNFPPEFFKASERIPPTNNYWEKVVKLPIAEIQEKINNELNHTSQESPILLNSQVVKTPMYIPKKDESPVKVEIANPESRESDNIRMKRVAAKSPVSSQYLNHVPGYVAGQPVSFIAQQIKNGFRPALQQSFSGRPYICYRPQPVTPKPQISIMLNYKMCSYLGDYGAGRTLKTFSLLPGEKTTITVRNYTHNESVKTQAENVLDSFSESSADELETLVQNEMSNILNSSNTSSETSANSSESNWNVGGEIGCAWASVSASVGGSSSTSSSNTNTFGSSVQNQNAALENALSSQVNKADSVREIEVNSETTMTSISESEKLVVRELENINHSRVLNFVFRQLLQEFFTITFLDDVSICYSNGYPGSFKRVKLSDIDTLLEDVLDPAHVTEVRQRIFTYLCNVPDHTGTLTSFIEKVEDTLNCCIDDKAPTLTQSYVRKKKDLFQTYEGKEVHGIITNVKHRIVRTPALVVDALLGQGEALDCYNQKLQNEATITAQLDNHKLQQEMDIINAIPDPMEKAKLYKKVFGECCDVPQSCCCGDCNPPQPAS